MCSTKDCCCLVQRIRSSLFLYSRLVCEMNKFADRVLFGPTKYITETGLTLGGAIRHAKQWTPALARYGVVAAGLALYIFAEISSFWLLTRLGLQPHLTGSPRTFHILRLMTARRSDWLSLRQKNRTSWRFSC